MAANREYEDTGGAINLSDGTERLHHVLLTDTPDMPDVPFWVQYGPSGRIHRVDAYPWIDQPHDATIQLLRTAPTPVGRSESTTWDLESPVGRTESTTWDVEAPVGRTESTTWDVETDAGGGGDYANLSLVPGLPLVQVAEPFNTINLPNAVNGAHWAYSQFPWPPSGAATVRVVDGAWEWVFPAGYLAGSSPGRAVTEPKSAFNGGAGFRYWYVGFKVWISDPFTYHPSDNKLVYGGISSAPGARSQWYIGFNGSGLLTFITQYPGQPARRIPTSPEVRTNSTVITRATEFEIECVFDGNSGAGVADGRLRVFLDGVEQWDISDILWSPTSVGRFDTINLDPVYGGDTGVKAQTDRIRIYDLLAAGSNG